MGVSIPLGVLTRKFFFAGLVMDLNILTYRQTDKKRFYRVFIFCYELRNPKNPYNDLSMCIGCKVSNDYV